MNAAAPVRGGILGVSNLGRMSLLSIAQSEDIPQLTEFLRGVDLTLSGLDSATVSIWIERDDAGEIVASTGFELSDDRQHALIRSVAVSHSAQRTGEGTRLARFALARAAESGAQRAWLFSRRSGPFWQKLGFANADRDALVHALGGTHQVRLFVESGQLDREVAWSRSLL
jgi:N-acetylglutamate synthase-like GNAT family acetyltransferase